VRLLEHLEVPIRLLDHVDGGGRTDPRQGAAQHLEVARAVPVALDEEDGRNDPEQPLGLLLLGLALGVEGVRHQEQAVGPNPGGGEVGRHLATEALAPQEQVGGRGGRVAAERADRGPHRASQDRNGIGPPRSGLGKGEVEAQGEIAALGELAVHVLDQRVVHVVGRAVGDHDAHAAPRRPPAGDADHTGHGFEPVDRVRNGDLDLFVTS
jgi:hypothetical protein